MNDKMTSGEIAKRAGVSQKAVRLYDKKCEELGVEKLTPKETFKTVWKCYIPSVATFVAGIPCVICGNRVSNKRNAALAAAYSVTETALQEYKAETAKIAGEKKVAEIEDKLAQNKIDNAGTPTIIVGEGDVLFLESYSGRYFKSTYNKVQDIVNTLNADAIGGGDVITLSEFYSELGLSNTSNSDNIGWSVYQGGRDGLIKLNCRGGITPDNKPCIVIDYEQLPKDLY